MVLQCGHRIGDWEIYANLGIGNGEEKQQVDKNNTVKEDSGNLKTHTL